MAKQADKISVDPYQGFRSTQVHSMRTWYGSDCIAIGIAPTVVRGWFEGGDGPKGFIDASGVTCFFAEDVIAWCRENICHPLAKLHGSAE